MKLVHYTKADIEGLAQVLSTVESLDDRQRQLLIAIFAAAADRAKPIAPTAEAGKGKAPTVVLPEPVYVPVSTKLSDLKQQLLSAYLPGNDFNDLIETSNSGKVTEIHPS